MEKRARLKSRAFAFKREEKNLAHEVQTHLFSFEDFAQKSTRGEEPCTTPQPKHQNGTNAATSSPTDAAAPVRASARRSFVTTITPPATLSPAPVSAAAAAPPSTCRYP